MYEPLTSRRRRRLRFGALLYAFTAIMCFSSQCLASNDNSIIEVSDPKTKKIIACKKMNGKWEAGDRVQNGKTFVPYKDVIASLKKELIDPNSTPQRKKRVTKNLAALVSNLPSQKRLCKLEAAKKPKATPTPEGTASPGPTGAPTATPKPAGCSQPCFNGSRQTSCFGIPSGVSGSETSGQQLFAVCSGCHSESERRNSGFAKIKSAFTTQPQMIPFGGSYDNQDIADLAAYLNRFNPKQCRSDWP